jgi:hypothetical protein
VARGAVTDVAGGFGRELDCFRRVDTALTLVNAHVR